MFPSVGALWHGTNSVRKPIISANLTKTVPDFLCSIGKKPLTVYNLGAKIGWWRETCGSNL